MYIITTLSFIYNAKYLSLSRKTIVSLQNKRITTDESYKNITCLLAKVINTPSLTNSYKTKLLRPLNSMCCKILLQFQFGTA